MAKDKLPDLARSLSFEGRLVLVPVDGETVLLDLASGALHHLNPAAAHICRSLLQGASLAELEISLAQSFGIAPGEAAHAVRTVIAALDEVSTVQDRDPGAGLILFESNDAGFLLKWEGRSVLQIDRSGYSITVLATPPVTPGNLKVYLQWAAPHVLALQHQPVLHASAVLHDGGVLAFAGPSGAGKTTLARLFAAEGARLVSEDLVLVSTQHGHPSVILDGERVLREWASRLTTVATDQGRATFDTRGLVDLVHGPTLPLASIMFLDAQARSGDRIHGELLSQPEGLERLVRNGFAELQDRIVWRELLSAGCVIVERVPLYSATVPDGLDAAREAVERYRVNTAS